MEDRMKRREILSGFYMERILAINWQEKVTILGMKFENENETIHHSESATCSSCTIIVMISQKSSNIK